MDLAPIGVIDSGLGGLAVTREIRKILPSEAILYYADTGNFPYGEKSVSQLGLLAVQAAAFLVQRKAKLIVIACNTLSSAALALLRQKFEVPFVGMVPAIKPASANTRNGMVGVIATEATVQGKIFADLVEQFAEGIMVMKQACPRLAGLVEAGEVDSPEVCALLHSYLDPMVEAGIDTLVLGCTHYSFLTSSIKPIVGEEVTIIDAAPAVARQVERVLRERELASDEGIGGLEYYVSGDREAFLSAAARLCPDLSPKGVAAHEFLR